MIGYCKKQFVKPLFWALSAAALTLPAAAQQPAPKVLFTIDKQPFYTDEFSRIYKKNLDLVKDESQKDLDQYLQLYIGYKLKVAKALKLKLDEKESYKNELKTYRGQLAKTYLTDSKVTQALMDEAYKRLQNEIRASHILITVDENAAPADTLAAYQKIMALRDKVLKGEDFGQIAAAHSQDPSAKDNKGDLGYFSAFRMVYAFESAAFNTPVGQVSKPVRTRFGYHLIKVTDSRTNRGDISVAHIMIMNKEQAEGAKTEGAAPTSASGTNPEQKIKEIYQKLQQGEPFEELARQFSEDKSSAGKGGVLNRFSSGQLSSEAFENVAFSLTKAHPISEPFQSEFGWHIIKLIERYPLKTEKEMQAELEAKISRDDRSRLIANSLTEKLRKKYKPVANPLVMTAVKKAVTDEIYEAKWKMPADTKAYDKKLFQIEKTPFTGTDLLKYLDIQQKEAKIKPKDAWVGHMYEQFVDQEVNRYYNDNLEQEFPDFAHVMQEYRDGLLLFDLMEKEIWERSKTDTLGLKAFYDAHINQYQWKRRAEVMLYSSTQADVMKKVAKWVKKGKTEAEIKKEFNVDNKIVVMSNSGTFQEGSEALPKDMPWTEGPSDVIQQGDYYFVVDVKKVLPAGPKSMDECKGKLVNDYQQDLEQHWVSDLRKAFEVRINDEVFAALKKELTHP